MKPDPYIAVIDDDEELRSAMASLMRSYGYRVESFGSAEDFLGLGAAVDCIVTDIRMPGMTGIELKIKLDSEGDGTPVIMITGRPDTSIEDHARSVGAAEFLRKPLDVNKLVTRIDALLGQGAGSA